MKALPIVIVLLLGPGQVVGYLYLAKAPSSGCAYACKGDDLVVTSPISVGYANVFPYVPASTARNSSNGGFPYPCLPLPPRFITWAPPYQDGGYWSVGTATGNSSSTNCTFTTGSVANATTTSKTYSVTLSYLCICSAASDVSSTSAFSWVSSNTVSQANWRTSPPGSRVSTAVCGVGSRVGIWNNISRSCDAYDDSNADALVAGVVQSPISDLTAAAQLQQAALCALSAFEALEHYQFLAVVSSSGGLSGFGTWGYQGSLSFDGQYYPDPDPEATARRRQAAADRRHLIIGLSLGLGIPVCMLLCAYLVSVAAFIYTWRRKTFDRQICDRIHNIILRDPSKLDDQARLFDILPFYSRMPRTPIFASLGWHSAYELLALYRSDRRLFSNAPLCALLPDRCRGHVAQAIVFAILKHENRWGATPRSMSDTLRAGRLARRDLAVLLRTTLESNELALWLHGLDPERSPEIPKRPTITQALLFRLPNTRRRLPSNIEKTEAVVKITEANKSAPLSAKDTWATTTDGSVETSDLDEWQIKPGEIEIDQHDSGQPWLLGAGAYGVVHRATLNGSQTVAVKSLLPHRSESAQTDFLKEIGILHKSGSENIVRFIGICVCTDKVQLVTEYMDGGDLYHALQDEGWRNALSWSQTGRRVALDITRGITHLHSRGIVHFDLKSPNILLTRECTAKVADVGLARFMKGTVFTQVSVIGTLQWAAPEMLRGEMNSVSAKADVYSLGVVIWEIVTGDSPSFGVNWYRPPRVPDECPEEVAKLIEACMSVDAKSRPTSTEVYEILLGC